MGKIEQLHLLPSIHRYFDKTFIELFPEKFCISHIFLAHCSFVLIAMENHNAKKKKKKNGKKKILKKLSPQKPYAL